MIKLAIFDMDGLLVDTEQIYLNEFPKILAEQGININLEDMTKIVGQNEKAFVKYFTTLFPDIDLEIAKNKLLDILKKRAEDGNMKIKKGAENILRFLKEKEVKIALASSNNRYEINLYLEKTNLLKYFECIISGEDIKESKPNPEIFNKVINYFNVKPSETIILEDSFNGIRAAFSSGANGIMIPDVLEPNIEMKEKAKYIFKDLDEVVLNFNMLDKY